MKTFSLIPAFAIAASLLTWNAPAQSPVRAEPRFRALLKDPADTSRIVNGTRLTFDSDGTYHFTIEYSKKPDQPALRLIIYRPKQHPPATDCSTALCWEEDVFSSSGEESKRQFDKEIKKGNELLVVAWEGGSSKARGGDTVDPDCPSNAPCGVPLSSTADRSKLRLTMTQHLQTAILDIERRRH